MWCKTAPPRICVPGGCAGGGCCYLFLGHEARPAVVFFQDLAEPTVAHDHPVVQQEQLLVYLQYRANNGYSVVLGIVLGGFHHDDS